MKSLTHTWYMTKRHLRILSRMPFVMALSLIQPIVWLLLFSALFSKVADIPGFSANSYVDFMAPGVIMMSALFSGGFAGMGMISDHDRGILDRFLSSPAHRGALVFGPLMKEAVAIAIQAIIMILLSFAIGARFSGSFPGIMVLILCSVLLGVAFGALSIGLALLVRKEEPLIAAVQFVLLPLTFLSGALMPQELTPEWIQTVARFNPVNWAVQAGHEALSGHADWGFVLLHIAYLLLFTVVCAWLATRAFRAYQRSM